MAYFRLIFRVQTFRSGDGTFGPNPGRGPAMILMAAVAINSSAICSDNSTSVLSAGGAGVIT